MKRIEKQLSACVDDVLRKGYTVTHMRVNYMRKLTAVTIRLKISPAPYTPNAAVRDGVYGNIETVEAYVQELEQL